MYVHVFTSGSHHNICLRHPLIATWLTRQWIINICSPMLTFLSYNNTISLSCSEGFLRGINILNLLVTNWQGNGQYWINIKRKHSISDGECANSNIFEGIIHTFFQYCFEVINIFYEQVHHFMHYTTVVRQGNLYKAYPSIDSWWSFYCNNEFKAIDKPHHSS